MNYNITAYLIFILLTVLVTVIVGGNLHKTGAVFLRSIFIQEVELMQNINNILLTGYYLVNIGFALYTLILWKTISSYPELISRVSTNFGTLILGLGIIHCINLTAFYITAKIKKVNF